MDRLSSPTIRTPRRGLGLRRPVILTTALVAVMMLAGCSTSSSTGEEPWDVSLDHVTVVNVPDDLKEFLTEPLRYKIVAVLSGDAGLEAAVALGGGKCAVGLKSPSGDISSVRLRAPRKSSDESGQTWAGQMRLIGPAESAIVLADSKTQVQVDCGTRGISITTHGALKVDTSGAGLLATMITSKTLRTTVALTSSR